LFTPWLSGIRIDAWDYLQWKNAKPISNDDGKIVAAELIVYSDKREEHHCYSPPY
jgi:hypothetical protein